MVSVSSRICPKCGVSGREFISALCSECYVKVYGLTYSIEPLEFTYCGLCGSYRFQGEWVEGSSSIEESIRDYALLYLSRKIKPTFAIDEVWIKDVRVSSYEGRGVYGLEVIIAGRSGNVIVEESRIISVKVSRQVCPICSKRILKSGYSAIIQVRPVIGKLNDSIKRDIGMFLSSLGSRVSSSIVSIESTRDGLDIMVEDQNIARLIASKIRSKYGGLTSESFKVTGMKGGEKKGILSISTRILNVGVGSILSYRGSTYILVGLTGLKASLLDTSEGSIVEVKLEDLRDYKLITREVKLDGRILRLKFISESKESLVFQDNNSLTVIEHPRDKIRVLAGKMTLGLDYLAYLLRDTLYVIGVSLVEES